MDRTTSHLSASTSGAGSSGTGHDFASVPHTQSGCRMHKRARVPVLKARTLNRPATQPASAPQSVPQEHRLDQTIREGHFECDLVDRQALKTDSEQPTFASALPAFGKSTHAEACVVGGGPAGLALAAELARREVDVVLIGHDRPFPNNYGVWTDEFEELGLQHTLDARWPSATSYFGEDHEVKLERGYGRVCRRKLRAHLVQQCAAQGVRYLAGEVVDVQGDLQDDEVCITLDTGRQVTSRLVTLAAGAAAGKFLLYQQGAPAMGVQTAYGIEADVTGYGDAFDSSSMLFMDFRRHHSGVWPSAGSQLASEEHPAGGKGLWGTDREVPSFLYAMPLPDGRVFLEETCLVAKPALPFATLKRRLERRLASMNVEVKSVHEEEWSYIPVGGPLPRRDQVVTAFGAAANLVHPATGYSIARSLHEAPGLAEAAAAALRLPGPVGQTSAAVWDALWPQEKQRQASFHVFGMELLTELDLDATNQFFAAFFRLPTPYWQGFLASRLSSARLIVFAAATFVAASSKIRWALVSHFLQHPAGSYMRRTYVGLNGREKAAPTKDDGLTATAASS